MIVVSVHRKEIKEANKRKKLTGDWNTGARSVKPCKKAAAELPDQGVHGLEKVG